MFHSGKDLGIKFTTRHKTKRQKMQLRRETPHLVQLLCARSCGDVGNCIESCSNFLLMLFLRMALTLDGEATNNAQTPYLHGGSLLHMRPSSHGDHKPFDHVSIPTHKTKKI